MIEKIIKTALIIAMAYLAYQIYSTETQINEIEKKIEQLNCTENKCEIK